MIRSWFHVVCRSPKIDYIARDCFQATASVIPPQSRSGALQMFNIMSGETNVNFVFDVALLLLIAYSSWQGPSCMQRTDVDR